MKDTIAEQLAAGQRHLDSRLDRSGPGDCSKPVLGASNIHYEIAERTHGIAYGGIGVFHLLARRIGLIDAIDKGLHLLKIHQPYTESDHVLNIAYSLFHMTLHSFIGPVTLIGVLVYRQDSPYG